MLHYINRANAGKVDKLCFIRNPRYYRGEFYANAGLSMRSIDFFDVYRRKRHRHVFMASYLPMVNVKLLLITNAINVILFLLFSAIVILKSTSTVGTKELFH